jgi:hypothetical protein
MTARFVKYSIACGVGCALAAGAVVVYWSYSAEPAVEYRAPNYPATVSDSREQELQADVPDNIPSPPPAHIKTPSFVKAIYMTSWVAGTPSFRAQLVQFADASEINAIVIDVKDYTGKVAFQTGNVAIHKIGSEENRVPDMRMFVETLHQKNIYTIARISVFQDPHLAHARPDLAVQKGDGSIWKDRKGLSWVDPASREVWEYAVEVARAAEAVGFDELNFDYIRFPSDGNLQNIKYPVWNGVTEESDVIADFFAYLDEELSDVPVPISLDLFGMTMTNYDDLNIGQVLEKAAVHADFIAPMVYPSHYPATWHGLANPAANPYEVIFYAMSEGERRLQVMRKLTASSTSPLFGKQIAELRPWIQDFDLGADYTADMIRKEKQAVYDAGLTSWMAWDPKNIYTKDAYQDR